MRGDTYSEDLAACVECGLCLPHCPTYRVTGLEARSPRGRIRLIREVDAGAAIDDSFIAAFDTCIGCLGCETACPSAVPYGRLLDHTRHRIEDSGRRPAWWVIAGLEVLGHPRVLRWGSRALAGAQRLGVVPTRLVSRRLPLRSPALHSTGEDVALFTGCVMDAWQREVHAATVDVLTAFGVGTRVLESRCCGALAEHAGLSAQADRRAVEVTAQFTDLPPDLPILVNSAGCGLRLVGIDDRVEDVHTFLARRLPGPAPTQVIEDQIAISDPCHLRHGQREADSVHRLLGAYFDVVALDDEGLCCGAGGIFSLQQPELATDVRDRKVAAIGRSGAPRVAVANPGCQMHLEAAGIDALHPMELLAAVLRPGAGTVE